MRLLKIRLKNLNSLTGEWEIDFTKPEYANSPLFIITGPTGSGKSTILDAICLALYGRTPRLPTISQATNEIMSRQASDCLAEVTFETKEGVFRASFKHRRTKAKSANPFGPIAQEVVDALTGQVLESQIKAKVAKVTEIVGMDFGRFTKSILLAQGGFAAFLEAPPPERSLILEKITQMDDYGRISILTYQRHAEEKRALELLARDLESLKALPSEERVALEERLAFLKTEDIRLREVVATATSALEWLKVKSQLKAALMDLDRQKQSLINDQTLFQPSAAKLALSLVALELESSYEKLSALKKADLTDQEALEKTKGQEIELISQTDLVKAEALQASQVALEKTDNLIKARPILKETLELDGKIASLNDTAQDLAKETQGLEARRLTLEKEQATKQSSLEVFQRELTSLKARLEATKAEESLATDLSGLEKDAEALGELDQESLSANKELLRVKDAKATLSEKLSAHQKTAQKAAETLAQLLEEQKTQTARLAETESPSKAHWRDLEDATQSRLNQINDAVRIHGEKVALEKELQGIAAKRTSLTPLLAKTQAEKETEETYAQGLDERLTLLAEKLDLARSVASLEERRAQLVSGAPCPLCGSLDHPYVATNESTDPVSKLPAVGQVEEELKAAKKEALQRKKKLEETNKTLAGYLGEEKHLGLALTENSHKLEENQKSFSNVLALLATNALSLDGLNLDDSLRPGLEPAAFLETAQKETAKNLTAIKERLKAADALASQIAELGQKAQKAQNESASAQRLVVEATLTLEKLAADETRLVTALKALSDQIEAKKALLTEKLTPYGITNFPPKLAQTLNDLRSRLKAHQKLIAEADELERAIIALNSAIFQEIPNLERLEADLTEKKGQAAALLERQEAIVTRRRELAGDLDPEKEGLRLENEVKAAEKSLKDLEDKSHRLNTELTVVKEKALTLTANLEARKTQLEALSAAFLAALTEKGLKDESAFLEARLAPNERQKLSNQREELMARETQINSLTRDKSDQLAKEEAKNLTLTGEEELTATQKEATLKRNEGLTEIGSAQEKLDQDSQIREKAKDTTALYDAQNARTIRFANLNELIGQSSGAKFRSFAQTLAFERLVANANLQLQKMTPRYLLKPDEVTGLSLDVIDNYQGGLIRPAKNLSGGESFLVSLALALGLSMMASENVEVNSLFLDEGFGSLDEESLDLAISALADLPQAEGKTIGIISHVAGLEHRVSTQIKVTPKFGGQSRLDGPGCREI